MSDQTNRAARAALVVSIMALCVVSACSASTTGTENSGVSSQGLTISGGTGSMSSPTQSEGTSVAEHAEQFETASATEATYAPTADEIVGRWVDAVNAADIDAFHLIAAPDLIVDDAGRTFSGIDQVESWSDSELIGVSAQIEVRSSALVDSRIVLDVSQVSSIFTGERHYVFTIAGGRITRIDITSPPP